MNQKSFTNVVLIVLVVVLAGIVGYLTLVKERVQPEPTPTPITISPTSSATPLLSEDRKNIVADDKILLAIDDDAIFNFFRTDSQLCNGDNITSTPNRKMFCENKETFKSLAKFASIVSSPDKMKIGFTVESDTLSPDKVVGIFYPSRLTDKVHFLTSYYLGNEFISFSPSGTYFVYQGGCFEGLCGLFIKNSETLAGKIDFNNPKEGPDARGQSVEFVRWLSDNKVEYKLGSELKQASF